MGRRNEGGLDIRVASIRIRFTYQGEQIKETLYLDNEPLPPTPANIKYATRVASEIRDKIRIGGFQYADYFPHSPRAKIAAPANIGDFMDTWYAQLELKNSTKVGYLRMKDNFWKPKLGHIAMDKVKHSDITKALKEAAWPSGKTRNNHLSMLRRVFELALADDLIKKNPCEKIEAATWQQKAPDPFTLAEADRIIASLLERYPQQVGNYVEFMFFSGLRTSEGMGLEWDRVDLNARTVHVDKGYVYDEMVDSTKTSNARDVTLNSRALAALRRQADWTRLVGGRIFHDPHTGKPWAYEQNFRKAFWAPTLKLLGIRYRRPYCTRSTYATVGLMAGVNPAYMAAQLGHGLDVFYKAYAKWINTKQDDTEMDKIEGKVTGFSPILDQKRKNGP
jgi:integrase